MTRNDLVKRYWAYLNIDGITLATKPYHGLSSRFSISSAYKNKMIKSVLPAYEAKSRAEAERIARKIFGLSY